MTQLNMGLRQMIGFPSRSSKRPRKVRTLAHILIQDAFERDAGMLSLILQRAPRRTQRPRTESQFDHQSNVKPLAVSTLTRRTRKEPYRDLQMTHRKG